MSSIAASSTGPGPLDEFDPFVTERWDLVAAAPWIAPDTKASFEYFAQKVTKHLDKPAILRVSRIVLLPTNNPLVDTLTKTFSVEHDSLEVSNTKMFGLEVSKAFVITARRLEPQNDERKVAG